MTRALSKNDLSVAMPMARHGHAESTRTWPLRASSGHGTRGSITRYLNGVLGSSHTLDVVELPVRIAREGADRFRNQALEPLAEPHLRGPPVELIERGEKDLFHEIAQGPAFPLFNFFCGFFFYRVYFGV